MNPRHWLVVAMIAFLPAPALGQDKKPDAKPKEIDKATIAAWEKRDFDAGWLRERGGREWLTSDYPKGHDAIPVLVHRGVARDLTDADLKDLPPVEAPFALRLPLRSKVTDAGLAHLARLTNLTWLDLGDAPITGEGFKHLADLKNLTTVKSQYTRVTDKNLKHLTGFKSLNALHLEAAM